MCSHPVLIYITVDTTRSFIFSIFSFKRKQMCFYTICLRIYTHTHINFFVYKVETVHFFNIDFVKSSKANKAINCWGDCIMLVND